MSQPVAAASRTHWDYCGEEAEEPRTVAPRSGDRWRVAHTPYMFRASFRLSAGSSREASPIYESMRRHLRRAGGWTIEELRTGSGFLAGLQARKNAMTFTARDVPDRPAGVKIYMDVESGCYEHPDA
ncbi:hypothetical protein [Spirillospora sp. NPDC029432]|uniref:hypothetical protein n=1 Tax=Spirillospora sp. NPDC029432 TaxID=3154599 RepID=UPI0034522A5D